MPIYVNLGSHTRKSSCHGQTLELCRISQLNHELNQQWRGRAMNWNVTDGLCVRCHHKKKNKHKLMKKSKVNRYRFYACSSAELIQQQFVVVTSSAFTFISVMYGIVTNVATIPSTFFFFMP